MAQQQVTVNFTSMVFTACTYLALAGAVWILLRLVQACFWLPRHLQKQNDVQRMLQDKVESYEKYIIECEEKEKAMGSDTKTQGEVSVMDAEQAEKWKERRECLEMLKRELNKVRDTDNSYDWDYLLEEDQMKEDVENVTEIENKETSKGSCESKVEAVNEEKQSEDKKEK